MVPLDYPLLIESLETYAVISASSHGMFYEHPIIQYHRVNDKIVAITYVLLFLLKNELKNENKYSLVKMREKQ